MRYAVAILCALALGPLHLRAATILAYVEEAGQTAGGAEARPVKEALLGVLFDRGHIVFDPGGMSITDVSWQTGDSPTLLAMATAGGAELILLVRAEARSVSRDKGGPTVEVAASYRIIAVASGRPRAAASGVITATNQGREQEMGPVAVARTAGAAVATAAHGLIGSLGSAQ